MKKVGLIGGMGPESTIPYYHGIVYGVQKRLGTRTFPMLTIESVDLFHVVRLLEKKEYDKLTAYLMKSVENLVNAGADFIALTANTAHIVYNRLSRESPVKMLSIVDATCHEALKRGYKKIGLLGTVFTMTNDFFKEPFIANGIEITTPNTDETAYINNKIYNELEFGIVNEDTQTRFKEIVLRMKKEQGIEAVILGCTELPMVFGESVAPVPCLDTMRIHINMIVDEILS